MALTSLADANAVNDLLHYLLGDRHVADEKAQAAAELLAGGAYAKLQAGVTPETVRARWATRPATGGTTPNTSATGTSGGPVGTAVRPVAS